MTKNEHFSLVLRSLDVDPDSWEYDNHLKEHRYYMVNKKLDCQIWIANGFSHYEVKNLSSYYTDKLYDLSFIDRYKFYKAYMKWKKNIPTHTEPLNVKVDSKYEKFLSRYDKIEEVLNDL